MVLLRGNHGDGDIFDAAMGVGHDMSAYLQVEKESGKNADVTSFPAEEDIVVKKCVDLK